MLVEIRQVGIERAFACAEDLGPQTTNYFAHESSAVPETSHDLLDRHTIIMQSDNSGIGILAPQKAFILQAFGRSQKPGIDVGCANRSSDRMHRFAHSIQQGGSGVFHEMPAVCNLDYIRQRQGSGFAIAAAPVTRQNFNRPMPCQKCGHGGYLTIRQKFDNPMPLKIAHNGAVAAIAPECPIVDAHGRQRLDWNPGAAAHHTKQCIIADWQHQSLGEIGGRAATQSKAEVLDEIFKARRSARAGRQDIITEPF
jgi:hypothetical protein